MEKRDAHVTGSKALTLCIPRRDGRVLLGMKKRGFGSGRWNGFGGKVEPGETVDQTAVRECREETCIEISAMEKVGRLRFVFAGDPIAMDVHIYRVDSWMGDPTETEEMRPAWYAENEVPFDLMWPDDKHWFPQFLAGEKFEGVFFFEGINDIVAHSLKVVEKEMI